MLLKSIIFLALISTAYCTSFKQCANGGVPIPIKVQINDCIEEPCFMKAGSAFDANITFDAPYDVTEMRTLVKVTFGPTHLELPVDKNSCENLYRGWCPLEVDERAIYNFQMGLPIILPPINFKLEVQLISVNENGTEDKIICFETLCTTIRPKNVVITEQKKYSIGEY